MKKAITFLVIAIVGVHLFSCASEPATAPAQARLGQTLEETLGIQVAALEGMLGKTLAEVEQIIGQRLRAEGNNNWVVDNYPAQGIEETSFRFRDDTVRSITITFYDNQNVFDTIVAQTDEMFGSSIILDLQNVRRHFWGTPTDGVTIQVFPTPISLNRSGRAWFGWMLQAD